MSSSLREVLGFARRDKNGRSPAELAAKVRHDDAVRSLEEVTYRLDKAWLRVMAGTLEPEAAEVILRELHAGQLELLNLYAEWRREYNRSFSLGVDAVVGEERYGA